MSRGFGAMQRYLLGIIGKEPVTFEQIMTIAFPEGSFESDMAKEFGASAISAPRSLRRALFKLCEADVIQKIGLKVPHSYRLHPDFHSVEFDPERIGVHRSMRDCFRNITPERMEKALAELDQMAAEKATNS